MKEPDYSSFDQFQVELDGTHVHFVDVGSGPPVVLVHGSPLSSYSFRRQIAALSSRFRVIAPDLPGFGQSEALEAGPIFPRQARILRRLIEHLDLNSFRLLVHDWGGPIGLGAIADHPEWLSQLVLVNTTLRSDFKPPFYWKQFTASHLGEFLLLRLNVFGWGLPSMMRAARAADLRQHYLNSLKSMDTRRTMLALERLEGYAPLMKQVEEILTAINVPTLIVWGKPDAYFAHSELRWLMQTFPNAHVHEIAGGGHFPMEDAPQAVNETLLRFFEIAP